VQLWWRRRKNTSARGGAANTFEADADDPCAICLDVPQLPCRTQCGHCFCTQCFMAWWRQQPGSVEGLHSGLARCPLCTADVTHLTPHFPAAEDGPAFRSVVQYNRGVWWALRGKHIAAAMHAVRAAGTHAALAAYAVGHFAWEFARLEMGNSFVALPRPHDERWRFCSAWLVISNCCALVWLGPRGVRPNPLLHATSEFFLRLATYWGDTRHARLRLDSADFISDLLVELRLADAVCSISRLLLRVLYPRMPDAVRDATPVLLQVLHAVEVLVEIGALACHLRLEISGARGLLMLVSWRRRLPADLRGLLPYEKIEMRSLVPFELITRRCCRLSLMNRMGRVHTQTVPWDEAKLLHQTALRAMHAFYGMRWFEAQLFPGWALADIAALPAVTYSGAAL